MRLAKTKRVSPGSRPAAILVWCALLLVFLLAMLGLVLDSGLLMANQRHAQNSADAAALAAAMHLIRGDTATVAEAAAKKFVTDYNKLADATVTVNFADKISAGPAEHKTAKYVEVIVEMTYPTLFIHIVGGGQGKIKTRAVAGYENLAYGEGAIVLDPRVPGLSVQGGAALVLEGSLVVNSQAAGYDQYGAWVDWVAEKYGIATSNNSTVKARYIQLHGGVDIVDNYLPFEKGAPHPLFARASIAPDPLRDLPIPTDKNGVVLTASPAAVSATTGSVITLEPGIYSDISIQGSANVTFKPGIYVLMPKGPNQGLRINGSPTVNGKGVMFYLTGSNYYEVDKNGKSSHEPGYYDALDGAVDLVANNLPTAPDKGKVDFASITINVNAGNVTFDGLDDPASPFNDILFFQRRRNTSAAAIQGNAGPEINLGGTIYTKWANFGLSGGGRYDAQFVVGTMDISGQATVTLSGTGRQFGRANKVFLVQ